MDHRSSTQSHAAVTSHEASYRPIAGVMDEMMDADGQLRPGWESLIESLNRLSESALSERLIRTTQYLRDAGVYYRMYGKGSADQHDWPLTPVPLIIDESQWTKVSHGITQRAELLERVVADIYGPNELIKDGLLPPSLIASSAEYLRPMAGIEPASGHYLHFCAFELGRGPDGQWWVLGDRTQAASGAGFALENRVATLRAFADIISRMNVHRLAGFFSQFRSAISDLTQDPDALIGILTPGAWNETYYEHAYIARYLGFMLLEGENLVVTNDRLMVRTISGLKPVSVLWRRLDGAFADPLELNSESFIGTPGLVHALRSGSTAMVNSIGSGVLETRALSAFLPGIAEKWLSDSLTLPSIATWWCGQSSERDYVLENFDDLLIGDALSTRLPFDDEESAALGHKMTAARRAETLSELREHGHRFVAQEPVSLSTTPVLVDGSLQPRPVILRVFAARDGDGWNIMPGGFARVGSSSDSAAVSMQQGGQTADVWIVGDKPVQPHTLLSGKEKKFARRSPGILPSAAAENLFWLGRYVERAEQIVRVARAYNSRLAETEDSSHGLLTAVRKHMKLRDIDVDEAIPQGLVASVGSAVYSAGKIRDRFSPDGWVALNDLSMTVERFQTHIQPGNDAAGVMTVLLRKLAGFSGLIHENMYQFSAWRFLEIGRRLERAIQTASLINRLLGKSAPPGGPDMLLEIGDSVVTFRRFYSLSSQRVGALDLMALDPANPRSVLYQIKILKNEIHALPNIQSEIELSDLARTSLQLDTLLSVKQADDLEPDDIETLIESLLGLSNGIADTYF